MDLNGFFIMMMLSCFPFHATTVSRAGYSPLISYDERGETSKNVGTEIISREVAKNGSTTLATKEQDDSFFVTAGGRALEQSGSVHQTADGGYIIVGSTESFGAGESDILLLKYDAAGALSWARTTGGINSDNAPSSQQTTDGGYIVAGSCSNAITGDFYFLLLKYDDKGVLIWSSTGDGQTNSSAKSVIQTADGGYLLTGLAYDGNNPDVLLLKFDASGRLGYARRVTCNIGLWGCDVKQTADGGVIVLAGTDEYGILLLKYDNSGEISWARSSVLNGGDNDKAFTVQQTTDRGYIVVGYTRNGATYDVDLLLVKYDASGRFAWASQVGGNASDSGPAVQQTADGGYIVAGETFSYGNGGGDVFLTKYDGFGSLVWARTIGGIGFDIASDVQQTADGGYILAGRTNSYGAGDCDCFLLKVDADGFIPGCPAAASCSPIISHPVLAEAIPALETSIPTLTIRIPTLISSEISPMLTIVCEPAMHCYLELVLNSTFYRPDDPFILSVTVTPYSMPLIDRFLVILCAYDTYFFYPSWTEQLEYVTLNWPAQELPSELLNFIWPHEVGDMRDLTFYTGVLDENFNLVSNLTFTKFSAAS